MSPTRTRLNFDSDSNRPLYDCIWLGALHMLTGWDHLGVLALLRRHIQWRPAAVQPVAYR